MVACDEIKLNNNYNIKMTIQYAFIVKKVIIKIEVSA